ncbi:MAG TPA: CPBP family intramembrane glutamic endopeptidase [Gemmatimonadaceae bacterium]|nr:CPBP family intramembrane glutamic endopeptidase [Gemmatimonadaceae bacterium]
MKRSAVLYTPGGTLLRAPWRIAIFLGVTFVAWGVAATMLSPLFVSLSARAGAPGTVESLVAVVGLLVGHVVCVRYVDRRPWASVWMGREAARPAAWIEGWLLGALAIGVPCLVLVATGALRFVPAPAGSWLGAAARVSWFLLPAALLEELLTRGYLFAVLRDAVGWRVALGVMSVAFGLLHLPNNGATVESITMVTLAGVLLGGVVLATRSLYAAWMAHFAWNWAMAVPLHSPVSGFPLATPNYQLLDAGPRWLTGGVWGPEGGLAAAVGMMAALTYLYARRSGREES